MIQLSSFLWLLAGALATTASAELTSDSPLGRKLLSQARRLDQNNGYNGGYGYNNGDEDYYFLNKYSLKFQGCHHVQQWNDQEEGGDGEEGAVRVLTKRLARFRLCPTDSCSTDDSAGCTAKYGDYIVDLNTFTEAYIEGMQNDKQEFCQETAQDCQEQCGYDGGYNNNNGGDDDANGNNCMYNCFDAYGASACLNQDEDQDGYGYGNNDYNYEDNGIDIAEYAQCERVDLNAENYYGYYNQNNNNGGYNNNGQNNRRFLEEQEEVEYYVGPYCADQGGLVQLGIFTDETCTTFAAQGEDLYQATYGMVLPYSSATDKSLISTRCLDCGGGYNNDNGEANEFCTTVYPLSGKCETKMTDLTYPNEASCQYIEGIKIVRNDGSMTTGASTKKSKSAAVAIGVLLTLSVLLAGYVYYLRTKLGRAQINLSAAHQSASMPLT